MWNKIKKSWDNKRSKGCCGMYSAIDIARYIIKYCSEQYLDVSNLRLQKLLYFVQAFFLVEEEKGYGYPAFSDRIEAWDFGPVVPNAYKEFKRYGGINIPHLNEYLTSDPTNHWNIKKEKYNDSIISEHDKKGIETMVDYFKDWATNDLVKLTHAQQPWIDAYNPEEKNHNNEITQNSIKEYFLNDELQ